MANDVSFTLDATAESTRNGEYASGTPLSDTTGDGTTDNPYIGCNRAGSNAPGIGIATANGQCKLSDWTILDQRGVARDPQDSQHIGGNGLGAGTQGVVTQVPVLAIAGADVNDTFSLTVEATGWVKNAVV